MSSRIQAARDRAAQAKAALAVAAVALFGIGTGLARADHPAAAPATSSSIESDDSFFSGSADLSPTMAAPTVRTGAS